MPTVIIPPTDVSPNTGTGAAVFATSPTLVTPALGTPSALVGTNITGTAAGLTAGNVTTNANLTGDVTSVGNATSIAAGVIVDADINASAAIADTKLATISTAAKVSNSATTATSANTASAIVARDGSGNFIANTITAALTGNASTATALQTPRAINGVNFDGTAAITVTADASTLTGSTLASGVTASSLTSLGTIANLTATAGTISTTPSGSTDIANKLYVDTVAQGLDAKASCVAATTVDITLSGAQTIDGISVVAGNRVLVKNQTLSQNNGLYLCASGAWTRTSDADTWDELTSAFTFIEQGAVNADTGYVCTANAGGTLGTTALPWSQFSGAGTFTAGTGLTLTGSVFSLTSPVAVANGGTGLTSLGSGVATFLGTPSSANLAAAVTDETGSGALVFATSPTLVTPALGTPSSGTVTNLTGTASININGTVGATTPSTGAFTSLSSTTGANFATSSGAVAIGTATPLSDSRLTVQSTGDYSPGISVRGNASAGNWARMDLSNANTIGPMIFAQTATGETILRNEGTNPSIFFQTAGGVTRAMVSTSGLAVTGALSSTLGATFATSSGNVLIGTTTNSANGILQLTSHTTSAGGIGFGTDVTLYRSAANTLKTDDDLVVAGALAIGNAVNTVSPTSPDRTITIVIGGTTYYLHAKTTND